MTGLIDRVLNYLADYVTNGIVAQMCTLATNVSVGANNTSPSYSLPTKPGYKVAVVTPIVTGSYWGWYTASVSAASGVPNAVYFRNGHTSAHTNSFYAYVVYVKQ